MTEGEAREVFKGLGFSAASIAMLNNWLTEDVVRIVLTGEPEPYRERQRVFQKGKAGHPITYSYRAPKTRRYQDWLRHAAQNAMVDRKPFDCPVIMIMLAYMPIPSTLRKAERLLAEQELLPVWRRPDTTQLLKAAEDAFNKVVWTDDALVSDHILRRRYSLRPRLVIEVRPFVLSTSYRQTADNDPLSSTHACWPATAQGSLL